MNTLNSTICPGSLKRTRLLVSRSAGARPSWVDNELFPFESRFVEIDGNVVHYIDEGSGPILLMLHGNPTWSFVYRQVIGSLRDQFRCIALDFPGFGLSIAAPGYQYMPEEHAAVVVAFLDRLGLSDATLVAHDWGGPIGLYAAEQRADKFNASSWPTRGARRSTATCVSSWPPLMWTLTSWPASPRPA
jgi:haloalkane dehalogenase